MSLNPSIYDQLVQEQGDVVTEAREAADHAHRQAEHVLDWSTPNTGFPGGGQRRPATGG